MGRALIAAAAATVAAAAGAAGAVTPHRGWRALDDLAALAVAALDDAPELTGKTRAWGDPSAGCFGVVQELRTDQPVADPTAAVAQVHTSLHGALTAGGATFESWRAEQGVSTGAFRLGAFDAQTRTIAAIDPAGTLSVRSAVCFYNERDVQRSRDRCRRFLETL